MNLDFKNIQLARRTQASLVREKYTIVQNIVAFQHDCMWIQVCIGHSGVYRGHYIGVSKVGYLLVISHIWFF